MIPDRDIYTAAAMFWVLTLALLLIATPGSVFANAGGTKPAGVVKGPARVIDGDTIDISGQRIRLNGIDAPESRQTCIMDNQPWRCGEAATEALRRFIGNSPVRCEDQGSDRYGRMIGKCHVQGEGIEAWMVLNGWALAYRRYSTEHVAQEQAAQDARVGLWRGEFVPPWECGGAESGYRPPQPSAALISEILLNRVSAFMTA